MSVRIPLATSDRKSNSIGLKQKGKIIGSHKQKAQDFRHSWIQVLRRHYQASLSPLSAILSSAQAYCFQEVAEIATGCSRLS